jgi:hypothetical protein
MDMEDYEEIKQFIAELGEQQIATTVGAHSHMS